MIESVLPICYNKVRSENWKEIYTFHSNNVVSRRISQFANENVFGNPTNIGRWIWHPDSHRIVVVWTSPKGDPKMDDEDIRKVSEFYETSLAKMICE